MRCTGSALALALVALTLQPAAAVTPLGSADGQFWDIQDTSPWAQDSGGIATGGRALPFNGFGYLKLQVRHAEATRPSLVNHYLRGFGLARDGERFDSITPVLHDGVVVSRAIFAPAGSTWLRYYDAFSNSSEEPRTIEVAWGGATGAYEDGGRVAVATTSSGDRLIDANDSFVTVMQNAAGVADPMQGPSGHGPSAHVLGDGGAGGVFQRAGDIYADPFTDAYPGFDPAHIGYVFRLTLAPGQTAALVTFVVKGLSEVYDPRGGYPIARRDGLLSTWADAVYAGADTRVPAPGSEIARVTAEARRLVATPDLSGLTPRQRAAIVNWRQPPAPPLAPFTVFEQSVPALQAAMHDGTTTSEDIVREYLTRATLYDRSGPTFRAILALSPRAIADARERDRSRLSMRGGDRVPGPFHGVPIVLKDNIDATELPTTGGALALLDRAPRLDAHVVAGMRAGGAIILGKANLDEFPFGDFGVSTVGGTVGNAYDPSLSTSGSSGGSATAVATSLAALAFGTDTCNSLSNPSGFASLATIRTSRGLTSRAGVMPLNPFNDAVGPMGRSVRDIALALDLVTGADPADAATAGAPRLDGDFVSALTAATLQGARIGVFRQRFVGITGEREAAAAIERVVGELRAAGATVVEVAIAGYDEEYAKARLADPGALKAAWDTYLSRGTRPGDPVVTVQSLIASGKMAPAGQRRLESALAPPPADASHERFLAARLAYRARLVAALDAADVEALIYPANQARPHTHEGGAERYGTEPGTCEESASTGLPQVTVPAGYMGGRYPVGVSFLGRMWSDRKLLGLAYAYEQATRHRRPPPTVR